MDNERFIVAIGSSAGGMKGLATFFDATPHDSATYIVLRHLPVRSQTQIQEIMARHSKLAFIQAENNMLVQKDKVYFPPGGLYMTIHGNRLQLRERANDGRGNRAIDVFLNSLSEDQGKNSIAVILSGSGTDGTEGIKNVKKVHGLTIAQNPTSCEHPSMPENAIATGCVDLILEPAQMPAYIIEYVAQKLLVT